MFCAYMSNSRLVTHNLHDWFLSWCPFPSCPSVCLCLSMCVNCFHMVDRISSLGPVVMRSNWVESLSEEQIMLSYASQVLKTNTLPAARGWLMLVCQIFPVSVAGPCHKLIKWSDGQTVKWPRAFWQGKWYCGIDTFLQTLRSWIGYRPVGMAGAVSGAIAMPGPG